MMERTKRCTATSRGAQPRDERGSVRIFVGGLRLARPRLVWPEPGPSLTVRSTRKLPPDEFQGMLAILQPAFQLGIFHG